ncbi:MULTISPECIES: chemotaxis response regulator protein-glutamate methylesterase [unclassified Pseudomonas]|uniref:protein-glutamate methylesterase/protein-glutamine glutaminase n=1 Tax=unclassified Pseudomonas TaxID=196821 RepID=UPI000BD53565|nr:MULTISPECIES: chemotaxis response regulator protein-glutamate methylesterase [unclassified Pseudomonas]PVZ12495.1 two-component system chemotaxis response regulator CheB [Pseudomonas sp. URIL14HWK12:I12]PVZ23353.1 two-component system chemotaxis response regulator CheB [Pseudomonas sp. URIL14HWK12:I10]PVZ32683.1 two-component system chemotaxis response regulator CheB [Pseudomonas sp. URIL14HWK12:I11]SNZ13837.1 two-component system, chemotaxis family, response regulator CheB [Pseudomonas sp. 
MPISVLIIDDSAVVRQVLQAILESTSDMKVIGVASDPLFAMEKMAKQWPDVIVLDVEMPRMDGVTFLRKLMAERPTPVVICSTLAERGSETAVQALAAGAADIIAKPKVGLRDFLQSSAADLITAIRTAARANLRALKPRPTVPAATVPKHNADAILPAGQAMAMARTTERLVALGTSTGGTQALERVLTALPRVCPAILVVQHMPEKFTAAFAQRLDSLCAVQVREAQDNDRVLPGQVLIAPGGRHMMLARSGAQYHVRVVDGPAVNRHKPSVDVLFRSMARYAGANATGVLMTGMGDDGARGLKEMLDAGADTFAQDEASCVVFGMPREAIKLGAARHIVGLDGIAEVITRAG